MPRPSSHVAFRRLYDEHHAAVFAYCLRRASPEDAKDAAADVFLTVWRRFDDVPKGEDTLPWLYGTARRVLANQRRSRSRLVRLTARLRFNPAPPEDGPEVVVVRHERCQEVLDALARLRPADQEVIQLALWEELSQAAIGEALGCSARAVTMRLHRALRRLRRQLNSTEIRTIGPALASQTEVTHG